MGGKIAALLLLVVVIGGVVYLYNSGLISRGYQSFKTFAPLHPSSSFFPRFPSSPTLGGNPGGYPIPSGSGGNGGSSGGTGTTIGPVPTSSINPNDIPSGYTATQLSPYFHLIRFTGVTPGSAYNYFGSYGQISFSTQYNIASSGIDVTGWQIRADHGGEFIPQAVVFYDPLGLNAPSDITLKAGDALTLYSTSAPINLRLNECVGYLPNKSQFTPQLPTTCPYVDRSVARSFSGACQNYIYSLGSCQLPNLNDPQVPTNDYACRQYLENNFNYKSCYDAHFGDANFLSSQVMVWMGSSPLDAYHDDVALLDKNGLLVDLYQY